MSFSCPIGFDSRVMRGHLSMVTRLLLTWSSLSGTRNIPVVVPVTIRRTRLPRMWVVYGRFRSMGLMRCCFKTFIILWALLQTLHNPNFHPVIRPILKGICYLNLAHFQWKLRPSSPLDDLLSSLHPDFISCVISKLFSPTATGMIRTWTPTAGYRTIQILSSFLMWLSSSLKASPFSKYSIRWFFYFLCFFKWQLNGQRNF